MYYYTGRVMAYAMETLYDLNAKRYLALGLDNNEAKGSDFKLDATSGEYTPAALRRSGVR